MSSTSSEDSKEETGRLKFCLPVSFHTKVRLGVGNLKGLGILIAALVGLVLRGSLSTALGQKRKSNVGLGMSAPGGKADLKFGPRKVRF